MNNTKHARKVYTLDIVEAIKQKAKEMPKVEKEVNLKTGEAIKLMAKELHEMQEKGYTLQMILEFLKANDIDASLATLKNAIGRKKSSTSTTTRKTKDNQLDLLKDTPATAGVETTTRPDSSKPKASKSADFTATIMPDSEV